jgi:hypothetical protein
MKASRFMKIGAAATAVALVFGTVLASTAAYADGTDGTSPTTQPVVATGTASSTDATPVVTATQTAVSPAPVVASPAPAPAVVDPPVTPAVTDVVVVPSTVPLVATSAEQNNHNGNDPPQDKTCTGSSSLTWSDVSADHHLDKVTATLANGFTSCDISLHSYTTQGPTWETSGTQSEPSFKTVTLTKWNPTATLTVVPTGCFIQNDFNIGKQAFDGLDGQLPHYPDSSTPTMLIASWNGANYCVPPKAPVSGTVTFTDTTCNATAPVGNGAVVTLGDKTTATYSFNGGPLTNLAAGTYDDTMIQPGTYQIVLTGEDGSTLVFNHTFGTPKTAADCEVVKVNASIAATGACYYSTDSGYSFEPITMTFDNSGSNIPEDFVVSAPYGDLSRTVPAGETVTVNPQDAWQNGVSYEVTAGGQTFELSIPAFDSCAPTPVVVAPSATISQACAATDGGVDFSDKLLAGTSDATFTTYDGTTVYETDPVTAGSEFDSDFTLQYGSGPVTIKVGDTIVAGPVDLKEGCDTVVDTPVAPTPVAPTCSVDGSLPSAASLSVAGKYDASYNPAYTAGATGDYTLTFTTVSGVTFATGTTVSYDLTVKGKTGNCPITPAGNGGANTGTFGNQPGTNNPFWNLGEILGFGSGALLVALFFGWFFGIRPRNKRNSGETGVEA